MRLTSIEQIVFGGIYRCTKGTGDKKENFIMMRLESGKCDDLEHTIKAPDRSLDSPWGPPEDDFVRYYNVELIGGKLDYPEYFL